jgi:predicted SnoaL-like aldol condensation-catalyzing enzyme
MSWHFTCQKALSSGIAAVWAGRHAGNSSARGHVTNEDAKERATMYIAPKLAAAAAIIGRIVMLRIKICFAAFALAVVLTPGPTKAQEPVVKTADAEALFTSPDPKLHRNKQAAYHIIRDLLEAGQWDQADRWLTERYIQHNPSVASGRQGLIDFFTKVLKIAPKPIPTTTTWPVVAVVAEGDYVTVAFVRELKDPTDPAKTYTTTAFDMWRFVDGKADEHWDGATRPNAPL